MSRRRKALAALMRARMRAASDESFPAAAAAAAADAESSSQPSGTSDRYPPSSSAPVLSDSDSISIRPAASVRDIIKLVGSSISSSHGAAYIAGTAIQDFLQAYANLSHEGRCEFLLSFAREYDVDRAHVYSLMQQYLSLKSPSLLPVDVENEPHPDSLENGCPLSILYRIERNLREAIKPQYATFIEQLNAHSGGLKLLVDLRADLLYLLKETNVAYLRALDIFLKEKLMTWLSPATLELHQITWDDSASLLEKIVAYEAVHPIRNLLDLKRRLSTGRRCFGYLHPAMPGQPLIFIEVALLKNISHSVQEVLWDNPPIPEYQAECALFYSISSTQPGLSGINLGRFLIKRVIELIKKEMPHISTFATLSPIPGYMQWLHSKLVHHSNLFSPSTESMSEDGPNSTFSENILSPEEERQLMDSCLGHFPGKNGMEVMMKLLTSSKKEWVKKDQLLAALKPPLMRLCARYLLKEKKRGKALDVVANFHFQNGAMIECINWMADTSDKGFSQSGSIMVNYMYRPDKIEENAQAYSNTGKIQVSHDLQLYLI